MQLNKRILDTVKPIINGFTEENILEAETVAIFVCKECIPGLAKLNVPQPIVQAVNELLLKDDKLAVTGKITNLAIYNNNRLQRIIIAGFGEGSDCKPNNIRIAAGNAARKINNSKMSECVIVTPMLSSPKRGHYLSALVEGLIMGAYQFNECKGSITPKNSIKYDVLTNILEAEIIVQEAVITADAVCYTRDLVNLPANFINPSDMAIAAQQIAEEYNLEFEKLDVTKMEELGMNALLAVGQGSVNKPCLVTIKYNGNGNAPFTAYVGKGITFDSGGISIKPSENMGEMKDDMAGAGAVLGAIKAIVALRKPCNVMGIIACAENMPSGNAQRPGDIVKAANGKTIEVISTDAEGRMVLADAVWYACKQGVDKIIDIATLTGGVIIALGNETAGIIGNSDELINNIQATGKLAGESYWHLPSLPECKEAIKSDIADLQNSAGREASCITGGLFIGEFIAENVAWAHIDIGGTATASKTNGFKVKGGTGFGVRTLIKLAKDV